jgi:hypothetical protein
VALSLEEIFLELTASHKEPAVAPVVENLAEEAQAEEESK